MVINPVAIRRRRPQVPTDSKSCRTSPQIPVATCWFSLAMAGDRPDGGPDKRGASGSGGAEPSSGRRTGPPGLPIRRVLAQAREALRRTPSVWSARIQFRKTAGRPIHPNVESCGGVIVEVIGGLVSGSNLLLSVVIGVRLLRLSRSSMAGPEIWLAIYFLLGAFLGMGLSNLVYMSWADAAMALPPNVASVLNALYIFGVTAGMGCLYVFTWLTFRRNEAWARALVGIVAVVMVAGYAGIAISGDFELSLVPGVAYWVTWAARTSVFLWLLIETFRYWKLLRRRLRLGLADPLVANRFLLWGIWSSVMLLTGMIDPLARIWYVLNVGAGSQWVPELGAPATVMLVTVSSGLLILAVITLYLAFFPTPRFRRWVESRAPRQQRAPSSA